VRSAVAVVLLQLCLQAVAAPGIEGQHQGSVLIGGGLLQALEQGLGQVEVCGGAERCFVGHVWVW
jgi:hypothetical protein